MQYTHIRIYTYIHILIHTHIYIYIQMHIYIYIYIHIHRYEYIYTDMNTYTVHRYEYIYTAYIIVSKLHPSQRSRHAAASVRHRQNLRPGWVQGWRAIWGAWNIIPKWPCPWRPQQSWFLEGIIPRWPYFIGFVQIHGHRKQPGLCLCWFGVGKAHELTRTYSAVLWANSRRCVRRVQQRLGRVPCKEFFGAFWRWKSAMHNNKSNMFNIVQHCDGPSQHCLVSG